MGADEWQASYLTHADSMAAVVKASAKAFKEANQQTPYIFFSLLRGWYQAAPEARAGASWPWQVW